MKINGRRHACTLAGNTNDCQAAKVGLTVQNKRQKANEQAHTQKGTVGGGGVLKAASGVEIASPSQRVLWKVQLNDQSGQGL